MKIIKDEKILDVTEKAYNVVYRDLGYKPYVEEIEEVDEVEDEDEIEDDEEEVEEIKPYDEITKDEIIEKLIEKEIEHNPRDKKEVLYDLLIVGE